MLCDQGHANERQRQFCETGANPMNTDGCFVRQAPRRAHARPASRTCRIRAASTKAIGLRQ
eukprot:1997639-Karenia_brevis.AAC.1